MCSLGRRALIGVGTSSEENEFVDAVSGLTTIECGGAAAAGVMVGGHEAVTSCEVGIGSLPFRLSGNCAVSRCVDAARLAAGLGELSLGGLPACVAENEANFPMLAAAVATLACGAILVFAGCGTTASASTSLARRGWLMTAGTFSQAPSRAGRTMRLVAPGSPPRRPRWAASPHGRRATPSRARGFVRRHSLPAALASAFIVRMPSTCTPELVCPVWCGDVVGDAKCSLDFYWSARCPHTIPNMAKYGRDAFPIRGCGRCGAY